MLSRRLIKPYSSISKRAGEGVPYETVLTTESSSEQILPTEADVVVLGTAWHFVNFFFLNCCFIVTILCNLQVVAVLGVILCIT